MMPPRKAREEMHSDSRNAAGDEDTRDFACSSLDIVDVLEDGV
jgi:hypothetical protein